ncbi:MAG: penicillin-binding transpeptidase domain-containing protein, partial [Planctomycetota bacterium]|nr:penicillin-binding transpeptidase domain-containing protein [Planctomycetota bacterium]
GWPIDPGSTFKPIVALIALSEGVLSPGETIDCQGYFDLQDRRANRCENHSRGPIGLEEALAKSCNVFFYKLGQRLGLEKLIAGAEDFGFWQATIESDWRNVDDDQFDRLPSEKYGQKPNSNPVGAAIGRGFIVTPIQMAKAAMILARRGDFSPVKMFQVSDSATKTTKGRGRPVLDNLKPDHFESVIQGMQEAVEYGSAKNSRLKDYNAAVKTGTVRVMKTFQGRTSSTEYKHAWMIGFAPADQPKVAFAIVLQNQEKSGGKIAPLLEDALDWLQVNRGMKFR